MCLCEGPHEALSCHTCKCYYHMMCATRGRWNCPDCEHAAAVKIQAAWQAYKTSHIHRPYRTLGEYFYGLSVWTKVVAGTSKYDIYFQVYYTNQARQLLDIYIELATRPDHPATRYLEKRQCGFVSSKNGSCATTS